MSVVAEKKVWICPLTGERTLIDPDCKNDCSSSSPSNESSCKSSPPQPPSPPPSPLSRIQSSSSKQRPQFKGSMKSTYGVATKDKLKSSPVATSKIDEKQKGDNLEVSQLKRRHSHNPDSEKNCSSSLTLRRSSSLSSPSPSQPPSPPSTPISSQQQPRKGQQQQQQQTQQPHCHQQPKFKGPTRTPSPPSTPTSSQRQPRKGKQQQQQTQQHHCHQQPKFKGPTRTPSGGIMVKDELKDSIRTIETHSGHSSLSGSSRMQRRVSFECIEVVEYPITLGDHPCPADGPSITISWKPLRSKTFTVDYYERKKGKDRRRRADLVIPSDDRIKLLQRNGCSSEAIDNAMKEAEDIRRHRKQSIENMQWDSLSATTESISRKFRKAVKITSEKSSKLLSARSA